MIEPVIHRILVKQLDVLEEDKAFKQARAAGLILEGDIMKREQAAVDRGEVLAWGPTVFRDFGGENPLEVGNVIVFARHSGKTVRDPEQADDDQTKYILINDEDVIAILRKNTNE